MDLNTISMNLSLERTYDLLRPTLSQPYLLRSGAKLEHMIALRDEVELEYADRMEDLREMYRSEMDSQNEKFEAEKNKLRMLESSLQVKN